MEQRNWNLGLVSQQKDCSATFRRQMFYARTDRCPLTLKPIFIVNNFHFKIHNCFFDFVCLRPSYNDDGEKTSIYTMKPDGSDVTRLTDDEEGSDYTPSW